MFKLLKFTLSFIRFKMKHTMHLDCKDIGRP